MVASALTVVTPTQAGVATVPAAANVSGNWFVPVSAKPHYLRVINGSGVSVTVTVDDPNSLAPEGSTGFNPDAVVAVAAGATKIIKFTDLERFKDTGGKINFTYSAVTTVTVEVSA